MKRIIIGCGTGRCGTMSLSKLLSAQPDSSVTHELPPRMPWRFDRARFRATLAQLFARPQRHSGDVAFYWLPYLPHMLRACTSIVVVGLRRDREQTIESYVRKVAARRANHWMEHNGAEWRQSGWDCMYPKFQAAGLRDAIGKYWDYYYESLAALARTYPDRVRVWATEQLNDEGEVRDILAFCQYEPEQFVVCSGIHANAGVE